MDAGTNGTLYFDDFESRRFSYIGTLTDPGVDDPQATNAAGWFARTYQYSATIPHAVISVNPETGSPDTYTYDANGNMTCRVEGGITFKQDYNAENRISAIHKMNGTCSTGTVTESWLYGYDGDGVRMSTAHYTGVTLDSMTLYYMGGMYEVTGAAVKKYYSIAGQTVAMNDGNGLKYLLADHLGSTSAVVDANGSLLSQQRYLPFGEVRSIPNSPILQTDLGYTGQRNLSGTGLMDYRARFYSVSLGRFIQPDSIIPNPGNPQSLNRFGYVLNNPIRFNDPTGHVCSDPEDETPTCYGTGTTRVGNRMIRGNGAELGKAKNFPKKAKSLNLILGLHTNSCTNNSCYDPNLPSVQPSSAPSSPSVCGNNYFNCAIELPEMNMPTLDLWAVTLRTSGSQSIVYNYSGSSPFMISQNSLSMGGTQISYDGIFADYSTTGFAYIGDNFVAESVFFSGSSLTCCDPGHGPGANLSFGADITMTTRSIHFNENIRTEVGIRPIETVLVPILIYFFRSIPAPLKQIPVRP